jgi:hypothetical protein
MSFLFRRTLAVAALALPLPLTACIEGTPSLHPLFTSSEKLPATTIEGDWVETGDPKERLKISAGDQYYDFDFPHDAFSLRVVIGRLGDTRFLDFTGTRDEVGTMRVHRFARMRVRPGRLELATIKDEWLAEKIQSGQIPLAHEIVDDTVVITAHTEELQRVLSQWTFDETAYDDATVYVRPPAAASVPPAAPAQ